MPNDDILGTLTYDTARALVGRVYRVESGGRTAELTVTRVIRAAESGPRPKELRRDSFSIFFQGTPDVPLPQKMYDLVGESESFPGLFIVTVGHNNDGYEYEAVFN